jgi:ubiquinone/menaquinone biosynthesis C-methylase UbiE
MDATNLAYPDVFFDLVVGFGVLHRVVKYPQAGAQLLRDVKSGGTAVFHETLWNNPLLNLACRFTTEPATPAMSIAPIVGFASFAPDFLS